MTLVWNDDNMKRKGRKNPLSPTSRITLRFSKQWSSTGKHHFASTPSLLLSVAITARDKSKCQDAEHRRLHLHCEWLESWAGGQIPYNPPLFLRSMLRAAFRQNCSGKTSWCTHPFRSTYITFSAGQLQGHSTPWVPSTPVASETSRSSCNPLVWGRWNNIAMQEPQLAWLNLLWIGIVTTSWRRSLQAHERRY